MHRQMSRRERRAGQRGRGKATENLAFLYGVCLSTALAQALQLHLQPPQRIDALADMIDVRVQNVVHASAVLLRSVAEPQQLTYFVECHVARPAVASESQAIDRRGICASIVTVGTPRVTEQRTVGYGWVSPRKSWW